MWNRKEAKSGQKSANTAAVATENAISHKSELLFIAIADISPLETPSELGDVHWRNNQVALRRNRKGDILFPVFLQCPSVALPKWWRFYSERPQIDKSLPAMMNLVVDCILNGRQSRSLPLAERLVDLAEPMQGNLDEIVV